jgi:hypothetical protein
MREVDVDFQEQALNGTSLRKQVKHRKLHRLHQVFPFIPEQLFICERKSLEFSSVLRPRSD